MFGEYDSESPRLPSPWVSRSASATSSPLALPTPDSSNPSTPRDSDPPHRARRRSSLNDLLLDGLGDDFDSISLDKGRFLVGSPVAEQVEVIDGNLEGLQPEVDHQGHIEYKLKLLTPTSLRRLEKLRTQLKWRLVEGGGQAIYELGLLDNGVLVGLSQSDMQESLRTLGRMLAGLGGGRVQVARVVRLGKARADRGGGDNSDDSGGPSPSAALFASFDVYPDNSDSPFRPSHPSAEDSSEDSAPPLTATQPIPISAPSTRTRGPTPFPSNRTPDEKAQLRRDKRDARRARLAAAEANVQGPHPPSCIPLPSRNSASPTTLPLPISTHPPHSHPHHHHPAAAPDGKAPNPHPPYRRPPRAPKPAKSPPGTSLYKPVLPADLGDGEVRFVVEAVVTVSRKGIDRARARARARRTSSASGGSWGAAGTGTARGRASPDDDDEGARDTGREEMDEVLMTFGEGEEEEEEEEEEAGSEGAAGDEGWSYLEFDLERLSASVKSAAASIPARGGISV
ncbi:hypothetical protein JCM5296_006988 [Sporobolomyces johnsonii]